MPKFIHDTDKLFSFITENMDPDQQQLVEDAIYGRMMRLSKKHAYDLSLFTTEQYLESQKSIQKIYAQKYKQEELEAQRMQSILDMIKCSIIPNPSGPKTTDNPPL